MALKRRGTMKRKSYLVLVIFLLLALLLTACGGKSALPGGRSETDPKETESVLQAPNEEQDEANNVDIDLIDIACQMDQILIEVQYDHLWTWSPDGTENTGTYTGKAKDIIYFVLVNDGRGNLEGDTNTIFFTQEGVIIGDSGKCTITDGRGMAEMTLYGRCSGGVIELEWVEYHTGKSEATMICDGKDPGFITQYPLQFFTGYILPDDGLGYKMSDKTAAPFFRNISMEWTFRLDLEGKKE